MKQVKRIAALLCISALSIGLAACGSSSSSSDSSSATTAAAAEVSQEASSEEELEKIEEDDLISAEEQALTFAEITAGLREIKPANSYREELIQGVGNDFNNLDPESSWNYDSCQVYRMVYDTLLTYDDGVYGPKVATDWSFDPDDMTVIHITLRDDVYFTNGEKLTAEDVEYSLGRATYANVVEYYDHCDIYSDTELDIVLSDICTEFLYYLADTSTSIVCKSACEEDDQWGFAVSSGPWYYDLDSYSPGLQLTLLRNEDYWGEIPITKRFVWNIGSDQDTIVSLQGGSIFFSSGVSAQVQEALADDPNIGMLTYPSTNIEYIAFNTVNGGNVTDINLRKAVAYAINKDEILQAVGMPDARIAGSQWSWVSTGYFEDFDEKYEYNPDKAREYVALVDDPTFELMEPGDTNHTIISQMIQEQCRQVGITVNIVETDQGGLQAATQWGSATHEAIVYNLSLSDTNTSSWDFYMEGATRNRAFCTDERVQELLKLGAAAEDSLPYYAEIQQINNDYVYYIPLYFRDNTCAYIEGLGGVKIRQAGGMDFTYACIPED